MPTLSQTSTSTSSKTVVALAAVGGLAVAAMVVFGFSIKPKNGANDMLTPGYQMMPETLYRPLGDTPVIEEQKPRPIEPVIKELDQKMMIKQNDMIAPPVAPVKKVPVKK